MIYANALSVRYDGCSYPASPSLFPLPSREGDEKTSEWRSPLPLAGEGQGEGALCAASRNVTHWKAHWY